MSTTNTFTFLETIILDKRNHRTSNTQRLCASLISNMMEYTDQVPNIYHAILWAGINNHNANVRVEQEAKNALQPIPKFPVYNITFAGFLQRVMDTATREMYKLTQLRQEVSLNDEITLGGTGVDWAQDKADEVKLDGSSHARLRCQIDELYDELNKVHMIFRSATGDLLDDLYMYAPSVQDEQGNWSVPFQTNDFAEACEAIEISDAEYAANRNSQVVDLAVYNLSDLPGSTKIDNVAAPRSSEPDFEDDDIDQVAFR